MSARESVRPMTADEVVSTLLQAGVQVYMISTHHLACCPSDRVTDDLVELVIAHKDKLLKWFSSPFPPWDMTYYNRLAAGKGLTGWRQYQAAYAQRERDELTFYRAMAEAMARMARIARGEAEACPN